MFSNSCYAGNRFEEISLNESVYEEQDHLEDILERLDPSSRYDSSSIMNGLSAFERQLKRYNIKVSGSNSSLVGDFFSSYQRSLLFPEFVRLAVKNGYDSYDISDIIAVTTDISGVDYRSIISDDSGIHIQDSLAKIHKRGKLLSSSYELLRYQRISVLSTILKQIGFYIKTSQFKDAINVLLNNSQLISTTENHINCNYVINRMLDMSEYKLDTILVSDLYPMITGIENLGVNVKRSSHVPRDKIICLDRSCTLEMIRNGEISVDYKSLIDKKFEKSSISSTAGFSILCKDSSLVIKVEY